MDVVVNVCVSIFNRGDSCLSVSRWKGLEATRVENTQTSANFRGAKTQNDNADPNIDCVYFNVYLCVCKGVCVRSYRIGSGRSEADSSQTDTKVRETLTPANPAPPTTDTRHQRVLLLEYLLLRYYFNNVIEYLMG